MGGIHLKLVGVTAVVATLNGYTYRLFLSVSLFDSILGPSIRVIYSELFGLFTRNYCTHYSVYIYMGPVTRQVDDDQGIQSILCCALHYYLIQVIPT